MENIDPVLSAQATPLGQLVNAVSCPKDPSLPHSIPQKRSASDDTSSSVVDKDQEIERLTQENKKLKAAMMPLLVRK